MIAFAIITPMDAASLRKQAQEADAAMRQGRALLVNAIRLADSAGLSQRQIAEAVGRSQAEVNRLLRFHGDSPGGFALRRARRDVVEALASAGLENARVFGSVARGDDTVQSDVDLLVTARRSLGLLALARAECTVSELVGRPVDLVLDDAIRPDLAESILGTAVKL